MTTLQAALALAQVRHLARAITDYLHLNVASAIHQPLYQDSAATEGGSRLGLATLERFRNLLSSRHHTHPTSTAAGNRLDHHRAAIAERLEECRRVGKINRSGAARQDRNIVRGGQRSSLRLVAKQLKRLDGWTDKRDPLLLASPSQLRALSQESISGMQSIAT